MMNRPKFGILKNPLIPDTYHRIILPAYVPIPASNSVGAASSSVDRASSSGNSLKNLGRIPLEAYLEPGQ
jgi:hypothetical protein